MIPSFWWLLETLLSSDETLCWFFCLPLNTLIGTCGFEKILEYPSLLIWDSLETLEGLPSILDSKALFHSVLGFVVLLAEGEEEPEGEAEEEEPEEEEPEGEEAPEEEEPLDENGEPIKKKVILNFKESDHYLRVPHPKF